MTKEYISTPLRFPCTNRGSLFCFQISNFIDTGQIFDQPRRMVSARSFLFSVHPVLILTLDSPLMLNWVAKTKECPESDKWVQKSFPVEVYLKLARPKSCDGVHQIWHDYPDLPCSELCWALGNAQAPHHSMITVRVIFQTTWVQLFAHIWKTMWYLIMSFSCQIGQYFQKFQQIDSFPNLRIYIKNGCATTCL